MAAEARTSSASGWSAVISLPSRSAIERLAAPSHKRRRMSSAIAQPAAETVRPNPARSFRGADLGLLPAARRRHLVVRRRADRVRAPARRSTTRSARTSTARSRSSNIVRRTLEAADLVTRYVAGRFARGDAGPEFTGTPGPPGADRRQRRAQRHLRRRHHRRCARRHRRHLGCRSRCRGSTSPIIPPSAPMSRATAAGSVRQPAAALALPRPEPDLAEPAAQPSGRLVRRRDRDQHPARPVHRLLPRRAGQSRWTSWR